MTPYEVRLALACCVEAASLPSVDSAAALTEQWERALDGECGPTAAMRAQQWNAEEAQAQTVRAKAKFITPEDPHWPSPLQDLDAVLLPSAVAAAPVGLWVRGDSSLLSMRGVAVVGARAATAYGEQVAADFGADLATEGLVIVSGGAYGIDAAAHRGALAVAGRTVMVSAAGVDVPYPRGLTSLWAQIGQKGCVVSEYPPGTTPARHRFLARNRLIAALAHGTILVEAAARSGAKNTVMWASRLSRVVMAVPGPVTSSMSVTPHTLIRDQEAVLVASAAEAASLVGAGFDVEVIDGQGEVRLADGLSETARQVAEALPMGAVLDVGEISLVANLSMASTWPAIAELESAGVVRAEGEGFCLHARPDTCIRVAQPARLEQKSDRLSS